MIPSARSIIYHNFINRSSPLIRVSKLNFLLFLLKKEKRLDTNRYFCVSIGQSCAPGTPYRGTTIRREFGIGLEDNARVESVQRRSVAVCLGRLRITYSQRELLFDRSSARPSASMHTHTHAHVHAHIRVYVRSLARSAFFYVHARDRARELTHREGERERERWGVHR